MWFIGPGIYGLDCFELKLRYAKFNFTKIVSSPGD